MKSIRITDKTYAKLKIIMHSLNAEDFNDAIKKLIDYYVKNNGVCFYINGSEK